jgi:2-haloacid dehalogenase
LQAITLGSSAWPPVWDLANDRERNERPMSKTWLPVLGFDVYGTLINPFAIEEHLQPAFGDRAKKAAELWRSKQLEFTFRRALMQKYQNFNVCTAQALSYVSAQLSAPLSERDHRTLLEQYLRLPLYPDAPGGLETLRDRGFKLFAFSNGTAETVRGLLEWNGIAHYFSGIVSVHELQTFKPDPIVYEHFVKHVRMPSHAVWLISSNPFDVIGAKACGLRAAWVQRDLAQVFDPWEFAPDMVVDSLEELAARLDGPDTNSGPL